MGSDIKSAFGGIGHGAMDFAVDSIHSLCIGATYIGSEDLGLNLYERINLLKVVEHSQIQRSNAIGSHLMGMMGINESDAFYHSFRSNTTWGLELGSLAVGGYGAVKGGSIGLSTWAKKIHQVIKLSKNVSPLLSNPLHGIKYSKKVLLQMEKNLTTGLPDFHGFPKIVDNYAGLGQKQLITGKDGLVRTKITLDGGYKSLNGHFEWIIEADNSVNHRLFNPFQKSFK